MPSVKWGPKDSPRLQGTLAAWRRWSPYTARPRPLLWSAPLERPENRWGIFLQELKNKSSSKSSDTLQDEKKRSPPWSVRRCCQDRPSQDTHTTFLNSQGGLVMSARYYKMSSTQTCLETRFKHVRWDGDGPVEDPSHPSGKQYAGNAELVGAAWVKQIIASEDVLKPSRLTGKTKHKPFPLWSEKVFEPLVGHEVHPAGWNVWNKTRKNYPQ